ncbi:RtcB family protein [Deinococcus cellulosilyticus]|uniref:3'-phosphate/5'-hydroxy nucleic acid ligase n=1 Tax=Deinococcus cellulosilyticus (strain DSM 18568 / NBRC 106333 / KACC 11606 / 5516J-15) TaxID=1223518 RepID=A0A511N8U7_DEIC1|nr:RtcB family protein [Deinococcus cellulosilyticus]GEM49250.1 RNA-splicing ligase RtcB [Deinococcus cellulosilyticus NBRC 106333 = KACC 11606]
MMTPKEVIDLGYQSREIKEALRAAEVAKNQKHPKAKILQDLAALKSDPQPYLDHAIYKHLAALIYQSRDRAQLIKPPLDYTIWGRENIEESAFGQMSTVMSLAPTVAGALMPDAHLGYGMPIGGVAGLENAVSPAMIGYDIACRVRISVFDEPLSGKKTLKNDKLRKILLKNTRFGAGEGWSKGDAPDHDVLDDPRWNSIAIAKQLKDKARTQIGTSGSGNHFVEFGILTLEEASQELGLDAGEYLALMSHSGSRGVGHKIATEYMKRAEKNLPNLDVPYKALAWLDLNTEDGQEYWEAMNLMGDYASANHHIIHQRIAEDLGSDIISHVENHHNFAWKEEHDGKELIVHRKGATPAGEGQLGVIPGSMTQPAYVVVGKGEEKSLTSASHGAGRKIGRRAAERTYAQKDLDRAAKEAGVEVIGAGVDEGPYCYKDVATVMEAQKDLVRTIASFQPKIVRMDSGNEDI